MDILLGAIPYARHCPRLQVFVVQERSLNGCSYHNSRRCGTQDTLHAFVYDYDECQAIVMAVTIGSVFNFMLIILLDLGQAEGWDHHPKRLRESCTPPPCCSRSRRRGRRRRRPCRSSSGSSNSSRSRSSSSNSWNRTRAQHSSTRLLRKPRIGSPGTDLRQP